MSVECGRRRRRSALVAGMKAITNGREWIDKYVQKKDANLGAVAQGLRRLMKKTVPGTKEMVNPWKIPTFE
jgi:hypothetical protein